MEFRHNSMGISAWSTAEGEYSSYESSFHDTQKRPTEAVSRKILVQLLQFYSLLPREEAESGISFLTQRASADDLLQHPFVIGAGSLLNLKATLSQQVIKSKPEQEQITSNSVKLNIAVDEDLTEWNFDSEMESKLSRRVSQPRSLGKKYN